MTDDRQQGPQDSYPVPCSGCGRLIYWIQTAKGKAAPVDLESVTGLEVTLKESRELRSSAAFVQGLDAAGVFHRIMREPPVDEELELLETRPEVTVWVNHFVTCPKAERFRRR